MRHDPWTVRTREVIGGCILGLALAGCGLGVGSPDLFALTRTGQGPPLMLVVSDGGNVRCNGGSPKSLPNAALLQARALARDLAEDAKAKLRLAPSARTVFSYTIRTQDGTVVFADTAGFGRPELARAEQFAVQAAREQCGLSG
jgi:hypothetical protein